MYRVEAEIQVSTSDTRKKETNTRKYYEATVHCIAICTRSKTLQYCNECKM